MANKSKFPTVIIVLSVLLVIALTALCFVSHSYFKLKGSYTEIPGNGILRPASSRLLSTTVFPFAVIQEGATELYLNRRSPDDSTPFDVGNMFPGDSFEKIYRVNVSYKGNVTVRFKADVELGYEKLSEVLKTRIVVQENGTKYLLYDGLMKDMPEYVGYNIYSASKVTEELTYYVTTYLDTSVGNEYQGKMLIADFRWWVPEEEIFVPIIPQPPIVPDEPDAPIPDEPVVPDEPIIPDEPVIPDEPDDPVKPDDPIKPDDPGELVDPPGTSDTQIALYVIVAVAAIVVIILLVFKRNKKEDDSDER